MKVTLCSTRTFKSLCLALLLSTVCTSGWTQTTDALAAVKASGVIRIANTQSSPPWSLLDEQNQPTGYDVDVARELAKRMGIAKVVFVADSFKNFVEGLKTGKYDLVMNDLTPTPERGKQVDFAAPYGVEDFRIFVRADNTDIHGRSDLKGKQVGVTNGSSNESWSRANLKDSVIRTYDNGGFVFSDLAAHRIDAVINSHFGGLHYAEVNHLDIKEVGEPLIYQLSAPALPKGQPALLKAVNQAIAAMMADGTIERLGKKWVGANYDMAGTIAKAQQE